ncbi:type II toxin-antitoxin system antitoxin DNA ADP-ribosyl glycohydrolase DarG [Persicirhabdus sediminis]|uniref:Macro domain-containing protein n=1 Tax=Persicirhabdus sediminis TaxID=454144 RepID=A0A8J7SPR3_9BACT|nr:macro domain-containing protein [Persicirhabdus sediminis]MBK1792513.1 macro domain-containing protein [Persicirhabdus sediminis]
MAIHITSGDLLRAEADALVNTVNCVGVMGKGIALQFKKKWPAAFKDYKKICDHKELRPGTMHVYELGKLAEKPYYIINFPTKDHWRGKSKVTYITDGLKELVATIQELGIKSIAIPPLGCGNGGLEWGLVHKLINDAFEPIADSVDIQVFAPLGAPAAKEIVVHTERPKMTSGRAILIQLISLYQKLGYSLSKVEVQKLCYFAQEAGQPLRLNYSKNQFGPYADNLRHVLNCIDGHFVEGVGDHDTSEMNLQLKGNAKQEAADFLDGDNESLERLARVGKLIEGFETPYGMELLATVHWVATKDNYSANLESVLQGIKQWEPTRPEWSARKTALMGEAQVATALEQLKSCSWL